MTGEEEKVVSVIKKLKSEKSELVHEEIYDHIQNDMSFTEFEKVVKAMLKKGILRTTSEKHYDVI